MSALFDGDLAAHSDLAQYRRRTTSVADADAAHRAGIVTAYYEARAAGDWAAELAALADATRYDAAHPGDDLTVELCSDGAGVAA